MPVPGYTFSPWIRLKHPEDAVLRVLGNSNSVVLEPEPDLAIEDLVPDTDPRLPVLRDRFDGIIEQVGDALGEISFMTANGLERAFDLNGGFGLGGKRCLCDGVEANHARGVQRKMRRGLNAPRGVRYDLKQEKAERVAARTA